MIRILVFCLVLLELFSRFNSSPNQPVTSFTDLFSPHALQSKATIESPLVPASFAQPKNISCIAANPGQKHIYHFATHSIIELSGRIAARAYFDEATVAKSLFESSFLSHF